MPRALALALPLSLLLSLPASPLRAEPAAEPSADADTGPVSPWSGGGELGFASARGNSLNESLNARLNLEYAEGDWIHQMNLFGLRARAEYRVRDGDNGIVRQRRTTANRYTLGANSARKLGDHRQFTTALRLEQDDFATYDRQQTVSIGYGTRMMDNGRAQLDLQIGPGYRRARDADEGNVESGAIGRGFIGLKFELTDNTELSNTLLVESGPTNTFALNELGVSVAMNSHLALKAGLQARRNSNVDENIKNTDTLTTMNVVYRFD